MKEFQSFFRLTALSIFAASLLACTEGKRKDSESSVYDQGMSRCKQLSTSLKNYDVDLSGNASTLNDNDAQLSDTAKEKTQLAQIQPLLEDYVLTADRLLALGDTNVVVFPERQSVAASRARAVKYLGQVYAERKWTAKEFGMGSGPDVDHAEFNVRSIRVSKDLQQLIGLGFKAEFVGSDSKIANAATKLNRDQLNSAFLLTDGLSRETTRIRDLLAKNNDWQDAALTFYRTTFCDSTGIYTAGIRSALIAEFDSRKLPHPGL